jgi:hypothetical protein
MGEMEGTARMEVMVEMVEMVKMGQTGKTGGMAGMARRVRTESMAKLGRTGRMGRVGKMDVTDATDEMDGTAFLVLLASLDNRALRVWQEYLVLPAQLGQLCSAPARLRSARTRPMRRMSVHVPIIAAEAAVLRSMFMVRRGVE